MFIKYNLRFRSDNMANITKRTLSIKEKAFEVPRLELYCEKCRAINFFMMMINRHINVIIMVTVECC
jgi:hypothetical protein